MQLASHLRLSRCGIYQFRLVLPANVAALLGQKSIIQSLNTKHPERARLAAYAISAKIMPLLREMRRAVTFDPNNFDPKNTRELIVKNLKLTPGGGLSADYIETSADPVMAEREMRHLERLARSVQPLPPMSEEAASRIFAEHDHLAAIVDASLATKATPMPAIPDLACSIEAAINAFMANKGGTAKTTQLAYRRRLNIFAQLAGGTQRMLHEIKPAQCVRISEALQLLPRHARDVLSADEILANPPAGQAIAKPTVKEYLILIQDFFDWAIGSLRYPKGENPFASIAKPSEGSHGGTGDGAEPFTQSELEKIFQPALFASMKRPYQFWGPLIALFTGARSNEIAQLRVSDITRENNVVCMAITHEPNHSAPTRTKNPSSVRTLPLHPKLLAIGFEDFVEDMRATGTQRLFGLPIGDDGKCERYLSRDFNEGLAVKAGVYKYRQKTLHSFRDTVANRLGKKNVWAPYINRWLGHANRDVQSLHYAEELTSAEVLEQIIPALNYDFLDLSGIRYQRGAWDEWVKRQLAPTTPRRQPRIAPKEAKATMAARKQGRADLLAKTRQKKPSATP